MWTQSPPKEKPDHSWPGFHPSEVVRGGLGPFPPAPQGRWGGPPVRVRCAPASLRCPRFRFRSGSPFRFRPVWLPRSRRGRIQVRDRRSALRPASGSRPSPFPSGELTLSHPPPAFQGFPPLLPALPCASPLLPAPGCLIGVYSFLFKGVRTEGHKRAKVQLFFLWHLLLVMYKVMAILAQCYPVCIIEPVSFRI